MDTITMPLKTLIKKSSEYVETLNKLPTKLGTILSGLKAIKVRQLTLADKQLLDSITDYNQKHDKLISGLNNLCMELKDTNKSSSGIGEGQKKDLRTKIIPGLTKLRTELDNSKHKSDKLAFGFFKIYDPLYRGLSDILVRDDYLALFFAELSEVTAKTVTTGKSVKKQAGTTASHKTHTHKPFKRDTSFEHFNNLTKAGNSPQQKSNDASNKALAKTEKHGKEQLLQEIERRDQIIEALEKELDRRTTSLAAEMNNKMSSDESSVENVSIRDRPMNIAEDLYNFCSNEWLEAKMALDEKYKGDEENLLRFLNAVLMPVEKMKPVAERDENRGLANLPPALKLAVGDQLRLKADEADLSLLSQELRKRLPNADKEFKNILKYSDDPNIITYINQATKLTWKMAIQRPPMVIHNSRIGKPWDEKSQEPYWKCDPTKPGVLVRFYVHPTLEHGESVMLKGKVFIK